MRGIIISNELELCALCVLCGFKKTAGKARKIHPIPSGFWFLNHREHRGLAFAKLHREWRRDEKWQPSQVRAFFAELCLSKSFKHASLLSGSSMQRM